MLLGRGASALLVLKDFYCCTELPASPIISAHNLPNRATYFCGRLRRVRSLLHVELETWTARREPIGRNPEARTHPLSKFLCHRKETCFVFRIPVSWFTELPVKQNNATRLRVEVSWCREPSTLSTETPGLPMQDKIPIWS